MDVAWILFFIRWFQTHQRFSSILPKPFYLKEVQALWSMVWNIHHNIFGNFSIIWSWTVGGQQIVTLPPFVCIWPLILLTVAPFADMQVVSKVHQQRIHPLRNALLRLWERVTRNASKHKRNQCVFSGNTGHLRPPLAKERMTRTPIPGMHVNFISQAFVGRFDCAT